MDFFEYQERARKRTGQLVVLYGLAVLGIIALVYVAVVGLLVFAASRDPDAAQRDFWAPERRSGCRSMQ